MNQTKEVFEKLNDLPIYLAGHVKPDQDSVCSCISLAMLLNSLGKKAYVLLEEKDKDILSWKNDHSFVVSDVHDSKFNFIALDMNEKSRLGKFEELFDKAEFTINIDHHQDNKNEADFTLSQPGTSSTCEMIFKLVNEFGPEHFSFEMCEFLYAGMLNDTNCFSRRLSSETLAIAQHLVNSGIDYKYIIDKTYASRTFYQFRALAKMVNNIKEENEFHYVVVDKSDKAYEKLSHNQIVKQIAEELRKIEGFDVFLVLIKHPDQIVAKVMSNKSANANKIAEVFGGGGHKNEAGFTVKNVDVDLIVKTTKEFLNKKIYE